MKRTLVFLPFVVLLSCTATRYYVVRHAEKEAAENMMTTDVPLSEAGRLRAQALKETLKEEKIRHIFSTNYQRTTATALPLSKETGIAIQTYDPKDTAFASRVKTLKGNLLIVGHSNTVDDLVNSLTGQRLLQDLPETQYGDLFIIKKRGSQYRLSRDRFGD